MYCEYSGSILQVVDKSGTSVKWKKVTQTIQYFVTINQELPSQYAFNNIFFKRNMEYPCAFINSTSAINSSEIFHYPESNSQLTQKSLFMSAFFHLTHSFLIE